MIIEAKPGIFAGGRIVADGLEAPVERRPGGWYFIPGPGSGEGGQVRYGGWRDVISVARIEGAFEIRFGWSRGTFGHRGRTYVVSRTFFGRYRLESETGLIASGTTTWGGLRDRIRSRLEGAGRSGRRRRSSRRGRVGLSGPMCPQGGPCRP